MIKRVVISKSATFSFRIIRWINVNQFDLSAELLFEGVEGDEVVAFDDKVFAYRAVLISLKFTNLIFIILITIYPPPV